MVFALPVYVHGESQIFAGLEEVEFFFQQQCVGAEIDVFFPRDEAFDDFVDLRSASAVRRQG